MNADQSRTHWRRDRFTLTTDRARVDLAIVHAMLQRSYWARGIPIETVARSIAGSLPFSIFDGDQQIGFARVVTDYATFAWIGDVFVDESYRGHGLGVWLIRTIVSHPDLQGLRRWMLATADAHDLYRRFGFEALAQPDRFMERRMLNPYGATP